MGSAFLTSSKDSHSIWYTHIILLMKHTLISFLNLQEEHNSSLSSHLAKVCPQPATFCYSNKARFHTSKEPEEINVTKITYEREIDKLQAFLTTLSNLFS